MFREEFLRPRNIVVIVAIVLIWRFGMKRIFAMLDKPGGDKSDAQA